MKPWRWEHDCGWVGLLQHDPVDLILTDPPYDKYVYEKSRRTRTGAGVVHDLEHSYLTDAQIALGCYAIAKRAIKWALLFLDIEVGIPRWRRGLEEHGMRYMGTGIWHKEPYTPQMTGDRGAQNYEAYLIMHSQQASKWNGGGHGVCFKHPPAPTVNGRHPTEKPVSLLKVLVQLYSNRGDTVADPYGGRASSLVAAIECGREAVGWEIDKGHHQRGHARLVDTKPTLQLLSDEQMIGWYGRELVKGGKNEQLFAQQES